MSPEQNAVLVERCESLVVDNERLTARVAELERRLDRNSKNSNITGARWGLPGAEAVLRLRALVSNGDLDTCWPFHAARKHARLYPAPDQGNCTLTT